MRPPPIAVLAACLILLTSCDRQPESATGGAALEQAALKAGAIHSGGTVDPAGLFEGDHGDGGDSLCFRHNSEGFGFELRLANGEKQSCKGSGIARRAGETLVLDFADKKAAGECTVVADYDGDRIAFPGAVDKACDRLCTGRWSLAGVGFVRADGTCGA